MLASFVHRIDPVLAEVGGLYLWYYGLTYTLGFLAIHLWFRSARRRLGWSPAEAYDLPILVALGVLLGARLVEVVCYEWSHYAEHLAHVPAVWIGGMSTHGVLLGALLGAYAFCRWRRRSFLVVCDELAVPGALTMAVGRLGNFVDGQIVGALTDVWWAVDFPDVEGFRHPVVLYDGLKNLALVPLLLIVRRTRPRPGIAAAHFLFWYGFLRIFVDLFREYRTELFGLGPGQGLNVLMALGGVLLYAWASRRRAAAGEAVSASAAPPAPSPGSSGTWRRRFVFASLLLLPLVIPSDWTQDVPARYGARHPGLRYSAWYPRIELAAPAAPSEGEPGAR